MTGVCENHSLFIKLRKIWLEAATCEPRTPKTEEQVRPRARRARLKHLVYPTAAHCPVHGTHMVHENNKIRVNNPRRVHIKYHNITTSRGGRSPRRYSAPSLGRCNRPSQFRAPPPCGLHRPRNGCKGLSAPPRTAGSSFALLSRRREL